MTPEQEQWTKNAGRWSHHLAAKPTWATSPELETFAKSIYDDPNADPNQALGNVVNQYRQQRTGAGVKTDEGDANVFGSPEFGAWVSGGRTPQSSWQPQSQPSQPSRIAAPAAGTQSSQALTQAWSQPAPSPQQAQNQQRSDELYSTFRQRSQQGTDIDPNDPAIRGQVDAYAAEEERARRNYLADVAEESGPYANLRGEERMASERMGQRVGGFRAQLVARALETRRAEITDALTSMGDMLSRDKQLELAEELARIEASMRKYGYDIQESQFTRDLGLRAEDRASYYDALWSGILDG